METQWTRMTANEAAEIIQHNDMVAFSGFTPAGSPKALPTAIARRANEQHEAKKPYQIRLLTGASISAAADDVLSDADAVSWRAPYQTSSGLRKKSSNREIELNNHINSSSSSRERSDIRKRACQNSLILKKSQSPDFHKPGLCYV